MTPPISLRLLPEPYTVHRLPADAAAPQIAAGQRLFALLHSPDEWSVVCHSALDLPGSRRETGWRCLMVSGPLDFALTGIVAALTVPLAAAAVPVFVVSSFDTDYLLVKEQDLVRALDAWRDQNIAVAEEAR